MRSEREVVVRGSTGVPENLDKIGSTTKSITLIGPFSKEIARKISSLWQKIRFGPSVESLHLEDLSNNLVTELAKNLPKHLGKLSTLNCNIGDSAAAELSNKIEGLLDLVALKLKNSKLEDGPLAFILSAYARRSLKKGALPVQVLDLSGNKIDPAGASLIGPGLPSIKPRELVLDDNPVGDEGIKRMAHGITGYYYSPRIDTLSLESCGIRDKSAQALGKIAAIVERLDLSGNLITNKAFLGILKAIEKAVTGGAKPKTLIVRDNFLTGEVLSELEGYYPYFKEIDLSENFIMSIDDIKRAKDAASLTGAELIANSPQQMPRFDRSIASSTSSRRHSVGALEGSSPQSLPNPKAARQRKFSLAPIKGSPVMRFSSVREVQEALENGTLPNLHERAMEKWPTFEKNTAVGNSSFSLPSLSQQSSLSNKVLR